MKTDWKSKIVDPKHLPRTIEEIKRKGKTVSSLNGSFDLMHAGHLYIIEEAAKAADVLIVALNTDTSIQKYKSPKRPIVPLKYRLQLMAALECVDFVTWFEETDPRNILDIIRPHVHVNGAEYGENCIEAATVKKHGGRIHLVDKMDGLSTSGILSKIYSLKEEG
jgi:rfaE bifunctional protein nucleotidyltransferase chain/domain